MSKIKLSPIESKLYNIYKSWKKGNIGICNRLGYESTMELIPQFQLISNNQIMIIDFVEPSMKIAIELDGFQWHYLNKNQVAHDKRRERKIILADYTLLRYTGSEVNQDPVNILEEIYFTYCLKCINKQEAIDGKK